MRLAKLNDKESFDLDDVKGMRYITKPKTNSKMIPYVGMIIFERDLGLEIHTTDQVITLYFDSDTERERICKEILAEVEQNKKKINSNVIIPKLKKLPLNKTI